MKFLELWQAGIEMWKSRRPRPSTKYPQHFSVEDEEDIEFMTEFVSGERPDWFVDDVFLERGLDRERDRRSGS